MEPLYVDAIALWPAPSAAAAERPATTLLGANERRRAPEAVLAALCVAEAAVRDAGLAAADVASVFTSAHGDLATVDALCRTLAADPLLLSPTRFHHSVHNAPSGYWAIGAGNRAPSTSIAAGACSFGAGWLEAASQCRADARPVLLVGCDTEARGALAGVNTSRGTLALALLLAPARGPRSRWRVQGRLLNRPAQPSAPRRSELAANAMAAALPLFDAFERDAGAELELALGPTLSLQLQLTPQ